MAWIEAHQTLRDHHKVCAVAEQLDIAEPQVIGHLVLLWMWGLDNAPLGVLPTSKRTIEKAADWRGTPGALLEAMLGAGLVDRLEDGALRLHDWHEYGQKLQEQRERNRERQARFRRRHANNDGDVTVTQPLANGDVIGDVTGTVPDMPRDDNDANNGYGDGDVTVTSPSNNGLENTTQENTTEGATPPLEGSPPPAKPAKRKTGIAEEFVPSAAMISWATQQFGFDRARIEAETEKFRDHYRAHGTAMKDWGAAWRSWIRKAPDMQPPGREPSLPASAAAIRDEEQRQEREQQRSAGGGQGGYGGWRHGSRPNPLVPRPSPETSGTPRDSPGVPR